MRSDLSINKKESRSLKSRPYSGRLRSSSLSGRASLSARQKGRSGFTLIEMVIALGVFLLLMAVVFVPLTQAVSTFNAGRADIELQQAAQTTMNQIEAELQRAVYVYPNDVLPSVTDSLPYLNLSATNNAPYYSGAACNNNNRISNTSRLDFLVAQTGADGSVVTPVKPEKYVVTYYARRINVNQDYDINDNPVSLFRAQMPYIDSSGSTPSGQNRNVSSGRYDTAVCDAGWLSQNTWNEPNLYPRTSDLTGVYGGHNMMLPRDINLPVPNPPSPGSTPPATPDPASNLTPELTFLCADTDSDGKIDRVTVNLALEQYENSAGGGQNGKPRRHVVHLSQTIDLPNIH